MIRVIKILCCSLLLLSTHVFAVCSQYMGLATLNELGKVGFIEIKLLDNSISESVYTAWKVQVCKKQGNKNLCSGQLSLSTSTDLPYIVVPTGFIPSNKAFDIILTDAAGETIDYLSVGYTAQQDNSCTLTYDWNASISNSHDYRRMPDGTGEWGNAGSGDSGGNTGGGPNEGDFAAYLTVADESVHQGETINFTVTLSSVVGSDVTFNYETIDNTALAGSHYTTTSGIGTILANSLTTTISVATVNVGDNTTRDFDLFISASSNAAIQDHFAKGEITPVPVPPPSCDIVFPGGQSFAGSGVIDSSDNKPLCNGIECGFEDFTSVGSINLDSNLGSFPDAFGTWTFDDLEYNYYTSTPSGENYRLITSGGTTAIYISGSSVFKKGAGLNVPFTGTGNPSELLIVVDGDLKIEENAVVNGFIYVKGNVVLEKNITFNGAVSASGTFDVKEGGRYTYDPSMLENFDPHGFCEPVESIGPLLALHRFEQSDFSTQIDDTSGLGNHAEKLTFGNSTLDGKYCRGFESDGWNLDVQTSDGFRSNLDIDNDVGVQGTISFWFNSTIGWDQGQERILFDATADLGLGGDNKFFALEIIEQGELRFAINDSAENVLIIQEPIAAQKRLANIWYYVTATWDLTTDTYNLYVDGSVVTSQNHSSSGALIDLGLLTFGDNASTYVASGNSVVPSPVSSRGDYDEVRIYNRVLTQAEIQTDMNDSHGCSVIDHFEIDTKDQQGVTCQADTITIKACADTSCSIINPDAVDVELSINNTVYKTVTVSGSSGTTTSYPYTTVGTAALSLDQTYECTNSSGTPCNVTFADSAFLFSAIPTQISGKSSNVGLDATTLTLQAIETDNNTGACIGSFPDGGDVPINLSYSCDNGSCSQDIALTNNSNSYALAATPAAHSIHFGADSTATFAINYPDAGQLSLNAQANVKVKDADGNDVLDGNGDPVFKNLVGSSMPFVERPFGFFINAIGNPKATDYNGAVFKKAGEDFSVQLKAVVWQSADDLNNDGVPDIAADLSDNAVTVGFGHESVPETAEVTHNLVAPLPGTSGGLTSATFTFSNGIASDNGVNYDEVGIINLVANLSDNSYLGVSDVQGNDPYVGRFIPSHFEITDIFDGSLKGTCKLTDPINTNTSFVYSGQMLSDSLSKGALSYLLKPSLTVTAKSSICPTGPSSCTTTKNYTGNFNKLSTDSFDRIIPVHDAVQPGKDIFNLVVLTANFDVATLAGVDGEVTYTYSSNDNYVYLHEANSEINEFTSVIDLSMVSIIDDDDVETLDNEVDKAGVIVTLNPAGKLIRFGRAQLENSYGPETSNLPQPLSVNYFKDGQYVISSADSCTPYNSTKITLSNISLNPALTPVIDADGELINETPPGQTRAIELTAPGAGNTGQVEVIYDISDWLKYDWAYDAEGVDGLFNDNPRAIATFGIYRGNDRIIYQREIER